MHPHTQVASTVAPPWTFITNSDLVTVGSTCGSDSAAVGLSETGTFHTIHVMCLSPPPELAFSASGSTERCMEFVIMKCLTKTCPSNTIYVGPNIQSMLYYSPCSAGFTSALATLDSTDCHVVEGEQQPRPDIASSWHEWRYCEGNSTHFYVMTEAVVTYSNFAYSLTSIKCCRIRAF